MEVNAPESDLCVAAAFLRRLWGGLSLTRRAPPLTGLTLHALILYLYNKTEGLSFLGETQVLVGGTSDISMHR